MVMHINYNGGKEASYQYNAVGDLVRMEDWTGVNTFEVDLLNRITKVTDHKGKVVTYGYDATGNQTSIGYPDGTSVTKTYDLVNNLESVTETDGRTTTYTYDGMRRVTHMEYPDGWEEDYTYDAIGQLLSIYDTDPSGKDMKQQKNRFEYDACGNMTYEYMRGNGTGEATVEVYYTYDELHQVVTAQENYGNKSRSYQYDSLGNLTWETNSNNVTVDYKLNNLNQITTSSDDGWKTSTTYTYDDRGNLIQELYTKNKKQSITGAYTFDETNKMVKGVNDLGESSEYLYNGLGALVTNTWTIKKNAYGYHDVTALTTSTMVEGEIVVDKQTGKKEKKDKKDPEVVLADAELNKTSTVVKDFVIDYTVETMDPLYETESTTDGLEYRYVYGLDDVRLSVTVKGVENGAGHIIENGDEIRLYYHQDLRGTVDYLTSPVSGKVESWTHYNEWGEITHNAVLKCGQRELDLVKNYTGHEYDAVLGMYYAKARFYDAEHRRFISLDPILIATEYDIREYVKKPTQLVQYLYVRNNPLIYVDPTGETAAALAPAIPYAAEGIDALIKILIALGISGTTIASVEAYYSSHPEARYTVTQSGNQVTINSEGHTAVIVTDIYGNEVMEIDTTIFPDMGIPYNSGYFDIPTNTNVGEEATASILVDFQTAIQYNQAIQSLINEYVSAGTDRVDRDERLQDVHYLGENAAILVNAAYSEIAYISGSEYYAALRCEVDEAIKEDRKIQYGDWCVYVLYDNADLSSVFYVGMTNNIERRFKEHQRTKGQDHPNMGYNIVKNNIESRNKARVHEQLFMVALFPQIFENKIRSISVENTHPGGKLYDTLISIIDDAAENEILALMDEVSFRH